MVLKWLTNIRDPKDRTQIRNYSNLSRYLKGKIIGEPKPTYKYTVDDLKAMGMVGVYVFDEFAEAEDGPRVVDQYV